MPTIKIERPIDELGVAIEAIEEEKESVQELKLLPHEIESINIALDSAIERIHKKRGTKWPSSD